MRCFNRSLWRLQRQTAKRIIIMPHTFYPHFWNTTTACQSVNKQANNNTAVRVEVCHWEDTDSIIIIEAVFIPVDTMKNSRTMGYISLFRSQCHPYWITRAGGRDVLGLEGRKDVAERKVGGGEVNVTPWFIVLSCHWQACIRYFSSFFPFFFCKRGGYRYYGWLISQVPTRADTN